MSEYIKLDDAIRTIQNEIDKVRVKTDYDGLRLAKKKLLDLRRATGKWVPVSERLPEDGYWLWSATSGEVKKDFYWKGHWELAEKYGYEVVAWMPLPEPYEESEE